MEHTESSSIVNGIFMKKFLCETLCHSVVI